MKRLAPRPLRLVLEHTVGDSAPPGLLASVQSAWPEVAGTLVAKEAEPVLERDGVVTIACSSAVWRQELELLAGELEERLNERLAGRARVAELRFRAGSSARS